MRRSRRGTVDTVGAAVTAGVLSWLVPVAVAQAQPEVMAIDPLWTSLQGLGFGGPLLALIYFAWRGGSAEFKRMIEEAKLNAEVSLVAEDRARIDKAIDALNRNADAMREMRP